MYDVCRLVSRTHHFHFLHSIQHCGRFSMVKEIGYFLMPKIIALVLLNVLPNIIIINLIGIGGQLA